MKAIHKEKTRMITKALILVVRGQEALNLLFQLELIVFFLKQKIFLLRACLDLDAGVCCSLEELQEILDHHGVSDAAECIEKRRNLLILKKLCSTLGHYWYC